MSLPPAKPDFVTVNIDGKEIAVPKGTNVIEAARLVGVDVPHYCYHPKLAIVGNCRMCLVEMGMPAVDPTTKQPLVDPTTGKQKINWMPRPQIGCATNASPGLHIRTATPQIKDCREGVMEFLLINHPLDCPICDQAGECRLQEQATDYGRGYSRFIEQKNVKPKRTQLGPRVTLDDERCILCSRCIRFSKDVAKDDVLGFIDRGSYSTLTCFPGKQLENNYSLNTVDICPVGALTSTDFRFKMRVWFLKQTNSIDTESSVGANTVVWSREGVIYRITPRRNDEVNDTWMADSGRVRYKQVRAENRLTAIQVGGQPSHLDAAIAAAARLLVGRGVPAEPSPTSAHRDGSPYPSEIAIVGSGRSSVEEQFLTKKLADALKAPTHLVAQTGEGDKLLISADRNPNTRGALVTGLINKLPTAELTELADAIDSGQVKTVLAINEDLTAAGLSAEQLAKVKIVYIGTHGSATTDAAQVILPTQTVFEKSGTFINQQFRLQKFHAAIPGLAGTSNDLVVLTKLLTAIGASALSSELATLWENLAAEINVFAGLSFTALPETGVVLASADFANLSFPEGETLHYKPVAKTTASATV